MTTPSLRQSFAAVWREARQTPPQPPKEAPPGEHWTFLWRTVLAETLTWRFLAVFAVVETVVIVVTLLR